MKGWGGKRRGPQGINDSVEGEPWDSPKNALEEGYQNEGKERAWSRGGVLRNVIPPQLSLGKGKKERLKRSKFRTAKRELVMKEDAYPKRRKDPWGKGRDPGKKSHGERVFRRETPLGGESLWNTRTC